MDLADCSTSKLSTPVSGSQLLGLSDHINIAASVTFAVDSQWISNIIHFVAAMYMKMRMQRNANIGCTFRAKGLQMHLKMILKTFWQGFLILRLLQSEYYLILLKNIKILVG